MSKQKNSNLNFEVEIQPTVLRFNPEKTYMSRIRYRMSACEGTSGHCYRANGNLHSPILTHPTHVTIRVVTVRTGYVPSGSFTYQLKTEQQSISS